MESEQPRCQVDDLGSPTSFLVLQGNLVRRHAEHLGHLLGGLSYLLYDFDFYPSVRRTLPDHRFRAFEAEDVSVYAVGDCLRPFGIDIQSTYKRQATLDDVFLELTGKALRE